VQNDAYTFDALGNLFTRSQLNTVGGLVAETFGYDSLNRLTSAQVSGQPQNSTSYDDIGNILTRVQATSGGAPATVTGSGRSTPQAISATTPMSPPHRQPPATRRRRQRLRRPALRQSAAPALI
jgi:hypothetical protein